MMRKWSELTLDEQLSTSKLYTIIEKEVNQLELNQNNTTAKQEPTPQVETITKTTDKGGEQE